MNRYRITKNVFEKDVEEIFVNLKEYNLSKLEYSEGVPLGIFKEDKDGKTGRVNWRNIRQLVIHQIFVDTFDFQAPEFYLKHGYKQVFELSEYPKTGKRHYYKKELQ